MNIYIIGIKTNDRLPSHETITEYQWLDGTEAKWTAKAGMVEWLDRPNNSAATMTATGSSAPVFVRREQGKYPYLQTKADSKWSNNLLALPKY
jgi:hypothetical protein